MKKFISALLVVMMLVSMIPASVFATEGTATITFNNKSKRTVFTTSQQVWVENGITVTNDKGGSSSNVADYASPARFYKSSKLTITYGQEISKIVFDCNSSSYATAMKNSISSSLGTTAVSSDKVTLTLATPATSIVISSLSGGQVRMDGMTITYAISTTCSHENVVELQDAKEPTCTETGNYNSTQCQDCEAVFAGEERPALGHLYEDSACGRCGIYMVNPDSQDMATVLTDLPGMGDIVAIYYPVDKFAMSPYDNGYSKLAGTLAEAKDGQLPYDETVAQFTFGSEGEYYTFMTADGEYLATGSTGNNLSLNDVLEDSCLWTVTANGTGTWNIISKSAVYNDQQQAIEYYSGAFTTYGLSTSKTEYKMALYLVAESVCEHTSRTSNEDGSEATCTEPGMTASETCDDCGANFPGEEIAAKGHEWVDGFCERCGIEKPAGMEAVTTLVPGQYVIVAHTDDGSYALPTAIATKMNGVKVTMDGEMLLGMEDESAELPLWTIETCGNGFSLYNGSKYLGWTSSTNFATKDEAFEWTLNGSKLIITATESASTVRGLFFQIESNDTVFNRFGPYGTTNTTGYVQELSFYKYEPKPELPPVVEMDGQTYTSFEEAYAYDPDTTIKLLTDFEEINVTGDLYLDLNGHTVGSVTANAIFAGDSSATATTAGTGSLTTTSEVIVDNKIGDVRYIALNNEGAYTFHVLDLKLDTVTLRTNKAGIYYKGSMACDEVLAAQIDFHGVAVSIVGMPTADFANEENTAATKIYGAPSGVFTSGSVTNIFRDSLSAEKNAARGEMVIYGNSYIQLLDGTVLMGANQAQKSLKDVMSYLNENYASLEAADQENAVAFYETWADAMATWELANLAAAIVPETEEAA